MHITSSINYSQQNNYNWMYYVVSQLNYNYYYGNIYAVYNIVH